MADNISTMKQPKVRLQRLTKCFIEKHTRNIENNDDNTTNEQSNPKLSKSKLFHMPTHCSTQLVS